MSPSFQTSFPYCQNEPLRETIEERNNSHHGKDFAELSLVLGQSTTFETSEQPITPGNGASFEEEFK